ncbi:MAG: hypothetical protein WBA46_00985 [Thermomicrobiales bacterium]
MVASLATPQQALDARDTDLRLSVWIGGTLTEVLSASGQQGVDADKAVCTIVLPLPRPAWLVPNAEVLVHTGHNDFAGAQFSGYVPEWEGSISQRGRTLTLKCDGWGTLLSEPDRYDWEIQGPVSAASVFVALCQRKGVPSYVAETVTMVDGMTTLMLGGNSQIDDGKVIFKGGSSPLGTFARQMRDQGYRVSEASDGTIRLTRLNGAPNVSPVATFRDGFHLIDARRGYSVRNKVSYRDLQGPTFEDAFGGRVPIRSIPTEDIADPEIRGGHRYRKITNSDLVRQDLADNARQVLEIDGTADAPVRWTATGTPGLSVGDVVAIADSGDLEADGTYWLTDLDWSFDSGGYVTTYTGSRGGGVALPSLVDRTTITIQTPSLHLGDEYVGWYAQPNPQGKEKTWTFTLPNNVSVANIRGWHHGTNSQYIDGAGVDDLNVTKWEVWKAGVDRTNKDNKAESTGTMPPVPEDYALQRPYWSGLTWWSQFAVNLRTLDAGDYVLVLICGEKAGLDDFEVQQVYLELFGIVEPAVIGERLAA